MRAFSWRWLLLGAVLAGGCDRHARKPVPAPARDAAVAKPTPPDPLSGWYHWIDPKKEYSVWFPSEPDYEETVRGPNIIPGFDKARWLTLHTHLSMEVISDINLEGLGYTLDDWVGRMRASPSCQCTISSYQRRTLVGWEIRDNRGGLYWLTRLLRDSRGRLFELTAGVGADLYGRGPIDPSVYSQLTTFLDSFEPLVQP